MVVLKPGHVATHCKPISYIVTDAFKGVICDHCFEFRGSSLYPCGGCGSMFYCGFQCQQADAANGHYSAECDIYNRAYSIEPFGTLKLHNVERLLLRTYIRIVDKEMDTCLGAMFDGTTRMWEDLDGLESLMSSDGRSDQVAVMAERLGILGGQFRFDVLKSLYAKIMINALNIYNCNMLEIGQGLYLETTIFEHSCRPNAALVFDGIQCEVRLLRQLDTRYEQVTIAKVDLSLPVEQRHYMLKHYFNFDCKCPGCYNKDDEMALVRIRLLFNKVWQLMYASPPNYGEMEITSKQILSISYEVFGTFRPEITLHLLRMAIFRSALPEDYNGRDFALICSLMEHIRVTHGFHHPIYQVFIDHVRLLNHPTPADGVQPLLIQI